MSLYCHFTDESFGDHTFPGVLLLQEYEVFRTFPFMYLKVCIWRKINLWWIGVFPGKWQHWKMKLKSRKIEIEHKEEMKVVTNLTGCPGNLWIAHPWSCSRTGWMGLWAIWLKKRYLCLYRVCGLDGLWMSLPTQNVPWLNQVSLQGIYILRVWLF